MPKSSYNSASNSSFKINKSFSMLKHDVKTIPEPILLVEGETDEIFYKRLIKGNVSIFYSNHYSESLLHKDILSIKICNKKKIFAIFDKDYETEEKKINNFVHCLQVYQNDFWNDLNNDEQNAIKQSPTDFVKQFIWITDAHSLETMLVKHCYKKKEKLQEILFNLKNPRFLFYDFRLKYNIIDYAIGFSKDVGYLRNYNFDNNCKFNFKEVKEQSYNYINFLTCNIDQSTKIVYFYFDYESYVKSFPNKTIDIQKDLCEKYKNIPFQDICQGHDLFNIIESMLLLLEEKLMDCTLDHPSKENTDFTNRILALYPKKFLKKSDLKKWLKERFKK